MTGICIAENRQNIHPSAALQLALPHGKPSVLPCYETECGNLFANTLGDILPQNCKSGQRFIAL